MARKQTSQKRNRGADVRDRRGVNEPRRSGPRRGAARPTIEGQIPGSSRAASAGARATKGERETPRLPRGKRAAAISSDGRAGGGGAESRVRDVMTPTVEVCRPDSELYYAARMMADRDVGAIPVVESTDTMKPIGIITDRDIVVRAIAKRQDAGAMRVRDCMSSGIVKVPQDASLDDCVKLMERHQVRRIVVADESGRCVGIVAQADIARQTGDRETSEWVEAVSQPNREDARRRYH